MNGANPGLEKLLYEVKKIVVGQDNFLERVLIALLAGGHLLVEGVPGLAKTLTVATLAKTMSGSFKRIQFTPDLVPADLIGTRIFNQKSGEFATVLGPVFANLVLADEINRAPAKVQSALLEVMQERQVTIAGESYPVPKPFVVMATQNPIETEGTYALPEAQVDRFMMKVLVGYPNEDEEFVIVQRVTGAAIAIGAVTSAEELLAMQAQSRKTYVDPSLVTYAVKLVAATRAPEKAGLSGLGRFILYGASPRASIGLIEAGRALAFLRGRDYVLAGATELIDACRPVLTIEVLPGARLDALSAFVSRHDYVDVALEPDAAIVHGPAVLVRATSPNHLLVPSDRLGDVVDTIGDLPGLMVMWDASPSAPHGSPASEPGP